MNPALIDTYEFTAGLLASSIEGLTPADLLATPVPNTWSIQQIVIHLMDSDLIASDRMKRIIAEENPAIIGFNETLFAQRLFYDKLDPFLAADIFQKNRILTAVILRNLPPEAFSRTGAHSERGVVTLENILTYMVRHLEHHLTFIRSKRQLLGKPLK